jgi:asparagine synthase (glutamine-hydrolysing)
VARSPEDCGKNARGIYGDHVIEVKEGPALMCGIFGIWNREGKPADLRGLQRATNLLRHRGPDDEGYLLVNTQSGLAVACGGEESDSALGLPRIESLIGQSFDLVFGFRRLAILDLSAAGHQPMGNADGDLWVVLNGEIYNYLELRQDLEKRGHDFRSQSDTETLLHGYEEYGEDILGHLNGMFAFVLWDRSHQRLFCARDRVGIKPFYYYQDQETFIFSSEIKAILQARPDLRSPNYPYLRDFLQTGLLDRNASTLFDRVRSLRAAHFCRVSANSSSVQRYWDFDEKEARESYDYLHAKETLRGLLQDSIRLQLRSDVPVGTCLSGGLDSSSVVALASSMLCHPMNSFSSVYQEPGYDEGKFVDLAASAFGTHSHIVQPTPDDFLDTLRRITWHMDEPGAGPGVYSQWFVMREAQGKVKVLLDGQGGDELLGGYYYYFFPYFVSRWRRFVAQKDIRSLADLGRDAFRIWRLARENFLFLGGRLFIRKSLSRLGAHLKSTTGTSVLDPDLEGEIRSGAGEGPLPRLADPLNDRLYWDIVRDSIPALLHYEDRNSMAFGIEARVPLLDHRLVEFCLGLPPDFKIRGDQTKVLLREAMADTLPPEILNRRDKKGYPTPMAVWLRDGLSQKVREFLLSPPAQEPALLDPNKVDMLLKEHCSNRKDLSWEIFRWVSCKLWLQLFFGEGSSFKDEA